jgi:4-amino-4-deoxy-L-arabinose transferase-like glycosyltransferase
MGFVFNRTLVIFVVGFGIFIRLKEYLANRSIWLDEASLALNVIHKSFLQLISQPLDYNQAAPVGFLLLTKGFIMVLGNNEYSLRAIPLLSGILSFLIFYKLLIKSVSKETALIAMFLFAASTEMLRYATEFKQYSSDVLIALLIQLSGIFFIGKKLTVKDGFFLGIIGATAIWFSYPSVFMLGTIGLVFLFVYLSKRQWTEVKNICVSLTLWGSSFILFYLFSLKAIGGNSSVERYWVHSFMPSPPYSLSDQFWFIETFVKIFLNPGMIQQALLAAIAFILGGYAIFSENKPLFFMLLTPLFLTLTASAVHQYPFEGRLLLFYTPSVYLLVARGLVFLTGQSSRFHKFLGVFFLIAILWAPMMNAYASWAGRRTVYREEIKPILNHIKTHMRQEDKIYVYYGADRAFDYYAEFYGFDKDSYIKGISSRDVWEDYRADLARLKGQKRVWMIFAHVYSSGGRLEENYMIDYVESMGTRLDAVRAVGASAYLYKFFTSQ